MIDSTVMTAGPALRQRNLRAKRSKALAPGGEPPAVVAAALGATSTASVVPSGSSANAMSNVSPHCRQCAAARALIVSQCLQGRRCIGVPQALQKRAPSGLRWSQQKHTSETMRVTSGRRADNGCEERRTQRSIRRHRDGAVCKHSSPPAANGVEHVRRKAPEFNALFHVVVSFADAGSWSRALARTTEQEPGG